MLKKTIGAGCLSKSMPEKLSVEYRDGITALEPVFPRHYTLTHSDITGDLFLTIGKQYAWDKINPMRDEVLGEWKTNGNCFYYNVYLYIDQGEYNEMVSAKRNEIFRRELPLALTAIAYGDRFLFNSSPFLKHASIIVNFMSSYPQFAKSESWGTFHHFSI
ncbi:staygreen family protein [Neobacillus sp. DY30]|uniref:staygreen family protein n=1 Tax=Neobacillus sp. DY30 TaxID=3047871 RepID=UPI0024C09979|nr:staygreen family protein [Neobacillus sp. DY30]WHY00312.1 staygreen family protein [Neobacillus sp. DY30]